MTARSLLEIMVENAEEADELRHQWLEFESVQEVLVREESEWVTL
jgi:hypothetical protein